MADKKKKFKILAASDIHGDTDATKKLAAKAKKENVDLVVLAGDLSGFVETEGILKPLHNLLKYLKKPYENQVGISDFQTAPESNGKIYKTFCGT